MRCEYVNCENEAELIVVLEGHMYHLCRKHFNRILRRLERKAKRKEVSLSDFKVRKIRGRIQLTFSSE